MRFLVATAWSSSWPPQTCTVENGAHEVVIAHRGCDWGKRGLQKYLHHFTECVRVLWRARRFDVLVLSTVGIEAFLAGRLRPLICPRVTLACFDLLMPPESRLLNYVRPWLRRCDVFLMIRRGDIATAARRFGIPAEKCTFVPFPANPAVQSSNEPEEAYIYSGGTAHRDWPTLIAALATLPYRAVISTNVPVTIPIDAQDRIQLLPIVSPEEGRRFMANSRVVVISMLDTDLPAGPLVLLDAMAMAKAVVATAVNGTRDYATNRETALMVRPNDSSAMARAIDELMTDFGLRRRLSTAAVEATRHRFTLSACIDAICRVMPNSVRHSLSQWPNRSQESTDGIP